MRVKGNFATVNGWVESSGVYSRWVRTMGVVGEVVGQTKGWEVNCAGQLRRGGWNSRRVREHDVNGMGDDLASASGFTTADCRAIPSGVRIPSS